MVLVTDKKYYMDGKLLTNYEYYKKRRDKKWDNIILIDGLEGSGKTTFASASAYYFDPDFGIDNVAFNPKQIMWALDSLPNGSSIQCDEFALGGMSGDALSTIQKTLIKKMTTIRKKNLTIFLNIAYIFMLSAYFAVGRTMSLVHIYSPDNLQRGYFRYYSRPAKRKMYFWGKKDSHKWEYMNCYNIFGRFTNTEGMFYDTKAYEKKKDEAISEIGSKPASVRERQYKTYCIAYTKYLRYVLKLPLQQIGDIIGVNFRTVSKWTTEIEKPNPFDYNTTPVGGTGTVSNPTTIKTPLNLDIPKKINTIQ